MSGKSNRGAKLLPMRRRRALAFSALALLVVAEAQETATSGTFSNLPFCGTKPITLGIHDGFGINAWSQESYAAVRSEAAKCSNVKQIVVLGGGDLQKSISDVNSMVAQGAKAIVMIPDFGQAQLASIQAATAAGVKVVPWGADPGGTPGKDYVSYVDWSSPIAGTMWANWMVKLLDGKGKVVFLGGPAGNPVTTGQLKSIVKVFAKHPGMKLLTGTKTWPVTNWDPATAQKQMAALLAKYPKIDGLISDYSTDALAATHMPASTMRTTAVTGSSTSLGVIGLTPRARPGQLARPRGRAQGDRSRRGAAEQGALELLAAVLRGLHDRPGARLRQERGAGLLRLEQDHAGQCHQVREALLIR